MAGAEFKNPFPPRSSHPDDAIVGTNDDATICKKSAVLAGYWSDPFIGLFTRKQERKAAEISRGYFARVYVVRQLIRKFVEAYSGQCQIISIGAGYDTTFWILCSEDRMPKRYVELDFAAVTSVKARIIQSKSTLLDPIKADGGKAEFGPAGLSSQTYSLLAVDVRDVAALDRQLRAAHVVSTDLPTLFVAEFVLAYMGADKASALLAWAASTFREVAFLNYDLVNMNDRFATTMLHNLSSRNCTLHVDDCTSVDAQLSRFRRAGWTDVRVRCMDDLYDAIPYGERQRVERLDFLDEAHLLTQLLQHYCVCWAWKGTAAGNDDDDGVGSGGPDLGCFL